MASKRSKLQLLFDLAQRTFGEAGQPSSAQVDVLKLALSSVPLAELGLQHSLDCACAEDSCPGHKLPFEDDSELQRFDPDAFKGARPKITYLHIHEDDKISLGIFCLPANAQIPLHNHPGMTVMSRVLFGKMHVKSYDWADPAAEDTLPREARRVLNRVLAATDEPAVLFPTSGGNIHQFTAVTDCAVLDLLSPPYSTDDGRDCIYYLEAPLERQPSHGLQRQPSASLQRHSSISKTDGGLVLLKEHEPPSEFAIDSGVYKGVPVRTRPYLLRSILAAAAVAKQSPRASTSPSASQSQLSPEGSALDANGSCLGEGSSGDEASRGSVTPAQQQDCACTAPARAASAPAGGNPSPTLSRLDLTSSGSGGEPAGSVGMSSPSMPSRPRRSGKKGPARRR
ncbi:hypothetical protein N2152v2_010427 [Parachlorella kessleri]